MHLTNTSSAYVEGMWGWTADHDMDSAGTLDQTVSTGRGLLVEATKGTWLIGTAFEHHTLYQYNFEFAQQRLLSISAVRDTVLARAWQSKPCASSVG